MDIFNLILFLFKLLKWLVWNNYSNNLENFFIELIYSHIIIREVLNTSYTIHLFTFTNLKINNVKGQYCTLLFSLFTRLTLAPLLLLPLSIFFSSSRLLLQPQNKSYKGEIGYHCWGLTSLVIHVVARWMDARSQPI